MIQLKTKGFPINITDPSLAVIMSKTEGNNFLAHTIDGNEIILSESIPNIESKLMIVGINSLSDLEENDIIYISTNGSIHTLFRKNSHHNALFITDRCNSNCLMCSQPPKNYDDLSHFFKINSELIPLIPKNTSELGITGGEPTLLGQRFVILLDQLKRELPFTSIHILTNGRSFAWKHVAKSLSNVENNQTIYGIPLYSDDYRQHDYIVQARDAFNQTVSGLHNMARYHQRLEIRVVLHKQSYQRLPQLAKYIYMNFPFVEHIAFMGLEYTGYTVKNNELLWIEPNEYGDKLEEAVLYLDAMNMNVSIYNLQLCILKPSLWKFTKKSISDWKQKYLTECKSCVMLDNCGGIFETSKRHSLQISAIR